MIEIRPHDVLLFRESRDFSAGENHVAVSIEPLPHTIAGALMSVAFSKGAYELLNLEVSDGRVSKKKPENEWEPGFSILGTFFALRGEPVFPMPRDIVVATGDDGVDRNVTLRLKETAVGDVLVARLPDGKETLHFRPATGFLPAGEFAGYLDGKGNEFEGVESSTIYTREERIGIGLTDGKVTAEGLLYRTLNLRLGEESSLQVYFEDNEEGLIGAIGERGLLKLGGESRFAAFKHVEREFPISGTLGVEKGTLVRLYFATPLIPGEKGIEEILREIGLEGQVVKLFTDKKLRITGWDLAAGMPKPTLYAYPPGTVVWIRTGERVEIERVTKAGLMKALGYGLVLAGVV